MSEQPKEMTVLEALKVTMNILTTIPVKVGDMQTIAQPIFTATHNLAIIIDKIEREEQAHGQDNQDPGENVEC